MGARSDRHRRCRFAGAQSVPRYPNHRARRLRGGCLAVEDLAYIASVRLDHHRGKRSEPRYRAPLSYLLEAAEHRIIRDTYFGFLEIRNSLNVIDVFLMLKGCSLEKNCQNQSYAAHPVIPAQAGI